LFEKREHIQIDQRNAEIFKFLGNILDNPFLQGACNSVSKISLTIFKLTIKRFFEIPQQILSQMNNFIINVGNEKILCNSIYASCFSAAIFGQVKFTSRL
jgi:hypothetical protein